MREEEYKKNLLLKNKLTNDPDKAFPILIMNYASMMTSIVHHHFTNNRPAVDSIVTSVIFRMYREMKDYDPYRPMMVWALFKTVAEGVRLGYPLPLQVLYDLMPTDWPDFPQRMQGVIDSIYYSNRIYEEILKEEKASFPLDG